MSIDYAVGDDHVVTITINRPEARNSLDMEHFFQLRSAWDRFGEDDNAYVAIVTGVGRAGSFSSTAKAIASSIIIARPRS